MSVNSLPQRLIGNKRWTIILPAVFIMYTISFFDRVNIGMALPHIVAELALTPVEAGWLGGAFAWGYVATQFTAGWLALRFGSRRVIGLSLFLFGACAMLTGLTRNFGELIAVRFLLGLAEGPIQAATAMFLAQWFIKRERGRAFGIWNLSLGAGAFLAGPISGWILAHHDWRIMMVIEGAPAWIFCIIWFYLVPKNLRAARWLSDQDRQVIEADLAAEQSGYVKETSDRWWTILRIPALWLMLIGYSLHSMLAYGFTLWLPTALKGYGTLSEFMVGFISGLPFLMTMVGIWYITRRSDKFNQERRLHAAIPTVLCGIALSVAAFVPASLYWLQIALFLFVGLTMKMLVPLVYVRLTEILPTRKAVPAVAFVGACSNFIGQFGGPLVAGYLKQLGGGSDMTLAWSVLGLFSIIGGILFAMAVGKNESICDIKPAFRLHGRQRLPAKEG
ncbi:D-galactonate transporter [Serratia odorifera]|uniref:Transporter, major facilitator family protein n=3 Tax=Serratia odorifera TaxID=618 RepID=D4E6I7_SEROD|nr:MFS transporter [Serratia odorifera]EFE94553.1 transporter, major facilitator family protein [Serratia odorifera DSM 4582]MBJ2064939.1 MFS transporter [Serratia odorifera]PNK89399.1 MFS transporter [Serratia odorifera]RII70356.1 MFS transporter [Serratia odorifera]VDZ63431.1 D-galactonate transporter [Serratia odorifera]